MTQLLISLAVALCALLLLAIQALRIRRLHKALAHHDAMLEHLSEGVLLVDDSGRIRQHNPMAVHLLDSGEVPLCDTTLEHWLPQLADLDPLAQRQTIHCRYTQRPLEISRFPSPHTGSTIVLLYPVAQDDAERFERSQYFARIGTWDWRVDTQELYWSDAIYGMFGHKPGSLVPTYELFCASVHPDDRERVRAGELRCIETGENHDEEYRVIWPDGTQRWLRETGNIVKDEDGNTVRMMGVVRDITDEKTWANQLHQLAHHDSLTGLPNRLVFEEHLGKALERARRHTTRVMLVFIDLNDFKAINDQCGHAAGDHVLVTTGERLRHALRESDTLARIGGDEFVVVLEGLAAGTDLEEEARLIADKIFTALALPLQLGANQQRIGASLGITVYPDHATSMDRMIHLADQAMYAAKRSGNNLYRLGSELEGHSLQRHE
ncbi:diguanylate cyclase [Pseudomonas sp. GD03944]|uniref:diguanylate cyclase domain-containing protein n=1 Tax=Pseudomonas sp. GD03944 TaxID=2975409 RepID=UPI00244D173E|nr:diguanylate cyclase [Pseudomonas sp. GD03944]MDH1263624.1 diguanylate cyclase [Pseudomonas sp. GD03944]